MVMRRPNKDFPEGLSKDLPGDLPGDLWVFGYGSLMWRPGFTYVERCEARLHGWHRRLCVYSHTYRGTPKDPGLVFGLDRGGSCRGIAYRVAAREARKAIDYLDDREMIYEVYRQAMVPVSLTSSSARQPDGMDVRVEALTYVVDRSSSQYAGALAPERLADIVARGEGVSGPATEYLANTLLHLDEFGLGNPGLEAVLAAANDRVERRVADLAVTAHEGSAGEKRPGG